MDDAKRKERDDAREGCFTTLVITFVLAMLIAYGLAIGNWCKSVDDRLDALEQKTELKK